MNTLSQGSVTVTVCVPLVVIYVVVLETVTKRVKQLLQVSVTVSVTSLLLDKFGFCSVEQDMHVSLVRTTPVVILVTGVESGVVVENTLLGFARLDILAA